MSTKNTCIVLSKIKYKDHDLIVKCYTSERGVVSYMLRGVLKSKSRSLKSIYFQPLSQLSVEENYKPNKSLHYFTEVKPNYIYKTLHSNIYKSSIVLFLSEVLAVVLKEEEKNTPLFIFIETTLQYLDSLETYSNFHLLFLLKLTRYLGFQPDATHQSSDTFNLESGRFEDVSSGAYSITGQNLTVLKQLLGINFDSLNDIQINANQRRSFLNVLLTYFELHLDGFKKPKSLHIFNEVFH